MRNVYIVSYDIVDSKRWRKVYRLLLGVGDPLHYSVFRCDLSRAEKAILLEKLLPVMNSSEDRLMLVDLGPARGSQSAADRIEMWGKARHAMAERGAVII